MYKAPHVPATFGRWSVVFCGRRKGLCTLSKVKKREGFVAFPKNDGRRGTFEIYIWRGSHFPWQAQYKKHVHQRCWEEVSQNCFVFDVAILKNSVSLAELLRFWCCQRQNIEEVSQNCFLFDVIKFKSCGSLAGLLRFQACRLQIGR